MVVESYGIQNRSTTEYLHSKGVHMARRAEVKRKVGQHSPTVTAENKRRTVARLMKRFPKYRASLGLFK
jgi:hypothetical protein